MENFQVAISLLSSTVYRERIFEEPIEDLRSPPAVHLIAHSPDLRVYGPRGYPHCLCKFRIAHPPVKHVPGHLALPRRQPVGLRERSKFLFG